MLSAAWSPKPSCTSVAVYSPYPVQNRISNVTYHTVDIRDVDAVRSILSELKPCVLVHLAYPGDKAKPKVIEDVVVDGTQNSLRCAAENSAVEAFVYTSTDQVAKSTGTTLEKTRQRFSMHHPEQTLTPSTKQ